MNDSLNVEWLRTLRRILDEGKMVVPRSFAAREAGSTTAEVQHHAVAVDAMRPVLTQPARKLYHRFMFAEAFWILTGDDSVKGIEQYAKEISRYSDDGVSFWGAYGPRVMEQLDGVVARLLRDPETRQATLTTWRLNPPPDGKDVPCTVAMSFMQRHGEMNAHVYMRSNDVWLGLPYDAFNFTMLLWLVCARVNTERRGMGDPVIPGTMYMTAASSHLYSRDVAAAGAAIDEPIAANNRAPPTALFCDPKALVSWLGEARDTKRGDPLRWWEA